jgi:hypothetical protein
MTCDSNTKILFSSHQPARLSLRLPLELLASPARLKVDGQLQGMEQALA